MAYKNALEVLGEGAGNRCLRMLVTSPYSSTDFRLSRQGLDVVPVGRGRGCALKIIFDRYRESASDIRCERVRRKATDLYLKAYEDVTAESIWTVGSKKHIGL